MTESTKINCPNCGYGQSKEYDYTFTPPKLVAEGGLVVNADNPAERWCPRCGYEEPHS